MRTSDDIKSGKILPLIGLLVVIVLALLSSVFQGCDDRHPTNPYLNSSIHLSASQDSLCLYDQLLLTCEVLDTHGNPLKNMWVTFSYADSFPQIGTLPTTVNSLQTNENGIASAFFIAGSDTLDIGVSTKIYAEARLNTSSEYSEPLATSNLITIKIVKPNE